MSYPTGITKNADGSFSLLGEFTGRTQTIPAGTPNPGSIMVQFFAVEFATALTDTCGYPVDNGSALLDGSMAQIT